MAMGKSVFKSMLEKLIALVVLFSMFTGILSPFANVKADIIGEGNYVKFTANNQQTDSSINVDSNKYVYINYGLTLTGGPIFNDLEIYVEDITEDTNLPAVTMAFGSLANATVSSSRERVTFNDSMNSGYSSEGSLMLYCQRTEDFSEYDKKIQLTLNGEYVLNGETKTINEKRTINVHVTPTPVIDSFSAKTNLDYTQYNQREEWHNGPYHWGLSDFTNTYEIKLDTNKESYSHLRFDIERSSEQDISKAVLNSEENLDIIVLNEPRGYLYNIVRENDGTTYVDITRGAETEEYDSNTVELSSTHTTMTIKVIYKRVEDVNLATRGATYVQASLTTYIEGYTVTSSATGVEYTKQTYTNTQKNTSSVKLWSRVQGEESNHYETWISGYNQNKDEVQEQIDNNDFTVKYNTLVEADIQVPNEESNKRLIIRNLNRNSNNNSETSSKYQSILDGRARITYKENGEVEKTKFLDNDEMTVKSISIKNFDERVEKVEFYRDNPNINFSTNANEILALLDEPFFTATSAESTFNATVADDITEYFAVVTGYDDKIEAGTNIVEWDTTWDININKLQEKININDIKNVRSIERRQLGWYNIYWGPDVQDLGTVFVSWDEDSYVSYANVAVNSEYNCNTDKMGAWEKNKNITISFNERSKDRTIKNINPKLYVKLPKEFEYRNFKVNLSDDANGKIYIKSYEYNSTFLIIELEGTYDSKYMNNTTLTITHDRCLKEDTLKDRFEIEMYMLTDNSGYADGIVSNTYYFDKIKDGERITPKYVMKKTTSFTMGRENKTETQTVVYDQLGRTQKPGLDNGEYNISSKEKPLVFNSNSTVKYESKIEVAGKNIKNLDFIIRLAKENNEPITTNEYSLDSTISLNLLDGIKLTKKSYRSNTVISPENYTILYSTQSNVGYNDTSAFQELEDTTDLTTVKTLRIIFNSDYILNSHEQIIVTYEMQMPSTPGVSAASTAVRYTGTAEGAEIEAPLESTPAYVECGNPNGTINLTKKFEGYEIGTAPAGISLEGIQFKFVNIQTAETLVLAGQTTAEGIVSTNSEGKIQLTDVPEGLYRVVEISTFNDYEAPQYADIEISQGEVSPEILEFENVRKKATVEINKTWEDIDEQPGLEDEVVEFTLTNTTTYKKYSAILDRETQIAQLVGIPYGTYTIAETRRVYGWDLANEDTTIVVSSETVDEDTNKVVYNAVNKPARGTIIIEKTVPDGDDVKDVTFKITSSSIKYINKQGQQVSLNQNIKLNVGEYFYNKVDGITVELNNETAPTPEASGEPGAGEPGAGESGAGEPGAGEPGAGEPGAGEPGAGEPGTGEPGTTEPATPVKSTVATITLENMPLGSYKIEEVEMPKIPETETNWYEPVVRRFDLNYKGETKTISITNNWQTGTLKIIKTAETGVDLSQFQVKVKLEKSQYKTSYEKVFNIPETGVLEIPDLYLGKYSVTELESDYYNAKYGQLRQDEPQTVTIEENKTTNAYIYNENTYGSLKILKTLEGRDAQYTIGIKFKLQGKDATGADVEQIIEITTTEEIDGKTYGVGMSTEPIQAGGEYELTEIPETMPAGYQEMEPMAVDIKKENGTTPLVLNIENRKYRGDLEITTKTNPEGGPLSPIRYSVTEVALNTKTYTFEEIGTATELQAVAGYAEMNAIYSGWYLIKQLEVPAGYVADEPILVEVPAEGTGYAEFIIEKPAELEKTMVYVEKEILTKAGNIATSEDIEKAQLKENESFEVKIKNVNTKKVYYTFFSTSNPGAIRGLPAGTYEIEEVYKPKYLNTAYLIKENTEYTNIAADENNKYIFTIPEVENDETVEVTIKVQNTINTDFGFGGQDVKDNLSKVTVDYVNKTTRTVIYILDEDSSAVPGAQFKIYDSKGNEVLLPFEDNTYTATEEKKVIINGLPKGTYTIKNTYVPEGFTVAEDRTITVYEGATLATRVEVWQNKPRGALKLSTVINNNSNNNEISTLSLNNNQKQYAPSSKYKIIDPITGKVLRFEKTASGNYIRSKSATATDTISLRAGEVTVSGIEVGEYHVGLVYVAGKYGVIKTEPELVEIIENCVVATEVEVKERSGFKKIVTSYHIDYYNSMPTYAITESGDIFVRIKSSSYTTYVMKKASELSSDPSSFYGTLGRIKAKDICRNQYNNIIAIVDFDGKVWTNFYGYETEASSGLVCISNLPNNPFNNVKIEKVFMTKRDDAPGVYAIDENGKIWAWGFIVNTTGLSANSGDVNLIKTPICISNNTILENVKITQISQNYISSFANNISIMDSHVHAIDENGNLYYWGYDWSSSSGIIDESLFDECNMGGITLISSPVCITTSEGTNLKNVKIKAISSDLYTTYFIDYDGNLWVCGTNNSYKLGISSTDNNVKIKNPLCLTTQEGNKLYGKKIETVTSTYDNTFVTDSEGKVYGWGTANYDTLFGTWGSKNYADIICLTDDYDDNDLKNAKIKYIDNGYSEAYAIDENGDLWCWGTGWLPNGFVGSNVGILPTKVKVAQDSHFDLFEVKDMKISYNNALTLDKQGKLWTTGQVNTMYGYAFIPPLTNYNSSTYGPFLEGITVKDFGISHDNYGSAFVIDTDNKLWTIGAINLEYVLDQKGYNDGSSSSGRMDIIPICLSDTPDCILYGKQIKYAAVSSWSSYSESPIAVIDMDGNLYTAGVNPRCTTNLGIWPISNSNGGKGTKMLCLNTMYPTILGDQVHFEKVIMYGLKNMVAIDTDGNVWVWGEASYCDQLVDTNLPGPTYYVDGALCIGPRKVQLSEGVKAVDVVYYYNNQSIVILDDEGNVHTVGIGTCPLENVGKKFVKIGATETSIFGNPVYGMDADGVIYCNTMNVLTGCGILAKDFYAGPKTLVIKDVNDELHEFGDGSPLCAGGDITKIEPNQLYKTRADRVIDERTFSINKGEIDEIYIMYGDGKLSSTQTVEHINKVIHTTNYTIVLDKDNHIGFRQAGGLQEISVTSIVYDSVIDVGDYILIKDTAGRTYKISGTNNLELLFDENTLITNWTFGSVGTFAQEADGTLWLVNDSTPQKSDVYDGGIIEKTLLFTKISEYFIDSNGTVWSYASSGTITKRLENIVEIKRQDEGTNALSAMIVARSADGKLYTWGYSPKNVTDRNYYQMGNTTSMDSLIFEVTSKIPEKVKYFKLIYADNSNYYNSKVNCLIAVTETNEIYACLPGYNPKKATKGAWGNIIGEYGEYLIDDSNNKIKINCYIYNSAITFSASINGTVSNPTTSSNEVNQHGTPGVEATSTTKYGNLEIKEDGELYKGDTCITRIPSYPQPFSRSFKLIKDTKYNY